MVYSLEFLIKGSENEVVVKKAVLDENFLNMSCSTPLAKLTLDATGQVYSFSNGSLFQSLPYGVYGYTVNEPTGMYYPTYGEFKITKGEVTTEVVTLKPAFGSLLITSSPEGAQVYVNNELKGVTPLQIERLKSGIAHVIVALTDYKDDSKEVAIHDGESSELKFVLAPLFAMVEFTCGMDDADIYINQEFKGKGSWHGRLMPGNYLVEARKAHHVASSVVFTAKIGDEFHKALLAPTPITGLLQVVSNVADAKIYIDGDYKGIAPANLTLLEGMHTLSLQKVGYETVERSIELIEGSVVRQTIQLEELKGKSVSFITDKDGAIYVNGKCIGTQHAVVILPVGTHRIEVNKSSTTEVMTDTLTITEANVQQGGVLEFPYISNLNNKFLSVKGVPFVMVEIVGGACSIGAQNGDTEANDDEKPMHQVMLSDYYMGETEVTQELWQAVMDNNPSDVKGANLPVNNVSWNDCQEFIKKLNALTGLHFSLPTEAQWEFAARGGLRSKGYKYAGSNHIDKIAWYYGIAKRSIHAVGLKQPNELGLYDMNGNVLEWCQDWYEKTYYYNSASMNPVGPTTGSGHVVRGGSWYNSARSCRLSCRNSRQPGAQFNYLGVRICLTDLGNDRAVQ